MSVAFFCWKSQPFLIIYNHYLTNAWATLYLLWNTLHLTGFPTNTILQISEKKSVFHFFLTDFMPAPDIDSSAILNNEIYWLLYNQLLYSVKAFITGDHKLKTMHNCRHDRLISRNAYLSGPFKNIQINIQNNLKTKVQILFSL